MKMPPQLIQKTPIFYLQLHLKPNAYPKTNPRACLAYGQPVYTSRKNRATFDNNEKIPCYIHPECKGLPKFHFETLNANARHNAGSPRHTLLLSHTLVESGYVHGYVGFGSQCWVDSLQAGVGIVDTPPG